jgi:predicted small secreted protein
MKKKTILSVVLIVMLFAVVLASCGQTGGGTDTETAPPADPVTGSEADSPDTDAPDADAPDTSVSSTGEDVTLIGDSVVLGAVDQIEELFPDIEMLARTDRGLSGEGLELLKQEEAGGKLKDIVVLSLGTNSLEKNDIDNALAVIGTDRQIVFVNAYRGGAEEFIEEINKIIQDAADEHPDTFTVADWYGYVTSHPDIKLAGDKCHLTESSAADYAELIKTGVDEARAKKITS